MTSLALRKQLQFSSYSKLPHISVDGRLLKLTKDREKKCLAILNFVTSNLLGLEWIFILYAVVLMFSPIFFIVNLVFNC